MIGYTQINGTLTLLENQTAFSPHSITGLLDGVYYYIIVAYNENGPTLSNCIEANIQLPSEQPQIPGYNLFLYCAIIGLISSIQFYRRRNRIDK